MILKMSPNDPSSNYIKNIDNALQVKIMAFMKKNRG